MRPIGTVLFSCFICFINSTALGDMVVLKNGGNIEGVIEKEDKDMITLNIGYGKISLEKKDIESIQRYEPKQQDGLIESWNYKYFARPDFIPENLKDMATDFDNLKSLRGLAKERKKEREKAKKESEKLEKELRELNAVLASVSEKLSTTRPQEALEKYNALVNEFNSLVAKIKIAEYNKNELQRKLISLNKTISEYINECGLFRNRFMKRVSASGVYAEKENMYFFTGVKKELDEIEEDFTKYTVEFDRLGLNIVVEVLLNGIVKTNLMVDTGASIVVISKDIAEKLGIDTERKTASILLTLADGRKVPANPIILNSIKVGEVEVKNVEAAVLKETQEEQGLLGMSFLDNFIVKIDAKNNRLVFEEFAP
jgi:clan AA aspartic protease (TIGR02281 family)